MYFECTLEKALGMQRRRLGPCAGRTPGKPRDKAQSNYSVAAGIKGPPRRDAVTLERSISNIRANRLKRSVQKQWEKHKKKLNIFK